MKLHILGSSSQGNCYIIEGDTEALIIEIGVTMREVKKALQWRLNKAVGAIITHSHNDHAGHIAELTANGIITLALEDVFSTHNLLGRSFTKIIQPNRGYKLGNFKILALPVKHDVPCLGYVIEHPEMGKLLFITDTVTFDYIVPKLTTIMIEANYADDILERHIADGKIPEQMRPRLLRSHMEISQTKAILRSHDLSDCNNIVLIHLSDGNSDEDRFVREVERETGKVTYAAQTGMVIDISNTPY